MNYLIDKNKSTPIYIQLYEYLKQDIIANIYPCNSKLPSKRILSDELGISIISVEHALNLLIEEGYIESKEKSGYYVIFTKRNIDLSISHDELINNSVHHDNKSTSISNEGDFPFSVLSKATHKVLLDYDNKVLSRSPNKGNKELRNEIAKYLARSRGIKVDIDQIVIGAGIESLYNTIAILFSHLSKEEYKRIAIEDPSYNIIKEVYSSLDKEIIPLKLYKDGVNIDELEMSNANLLHVTPFHSFPSRISISASKKHSYLEWANKESIRYIIEDNYDSELTISSKNEDSLFALTKNDNVIYLNTFSKTISSSFRVGYMILPKKIVGFYNSFLGSMSCPVSNFTQLIIKELIASGHFERHINRVRRNKRKRINFQ